MTEEHFDEHLQQVIPDDEEVEVDPLEDQAEDQLQDDEGRDE